MITLLSAITLPLIGDLLVAVLLVTMIAYAAVLNRRLGLLRRDQTKLEELTRGLTAASVRAEDGIASLKQAAEEIGKELDRKLAAGRSLKDDLDYLSERGSELADRLEGTIRARRSEERAGSEPRSAEPRGSGSHRRAAGDKIMPLRIEEDAEEMGYREAPPSRAERDLLRALAGRR